MENWTANSTIMGKDIRIEYTPFYWIVSVVITLTNIPVLVIVLKKKRFGKNMLRIQILSLSLIDLSAGLAMFGFSLLTTTTGDFSPAVCLMGILAPSVASDASNLHILVICIIRCYILFRSRHHGSSMVSKTFQITIFVCTWVSIFVLQIPKFITTVYSEESISCSPKLFVGANFHSVCRFVVPLRLLQYAMTVILYTTMTLFVFVSRKQRHAKKDCKITKDKTVSKVNSNDNKNIHLDISKRLTFSDPEVYNSKSSGYSKCYTLEKKSPIKTSHKFKVTGLAKYRRGSPHLQSLKTIGLIICLNSIFTAPFLLVSSVECWTGYKLTKVDDKILLRNISLLNSAINPFIYGFLMKDVRDSLRELTRAFLKAISQVECNK